MKKFILLILSLSLYVPIYSAINIEVTKLSSSTYTPGQVITINFSTTITGGGTYTVGFLMADKNNNGTCEYNDWLMSDTYNNPWNPPIAGDTSIYGGPVYAYYNYGTTSSYQSRVIKMGSTWTGSQKIFICMLAESTLWAWTNGSHAPTTVLGFDISYVAANTSTITPTITKTVTKTDTATITPTVTITLTSTSTPSPAVWKVIGGTGTDIGYISYATSDGNIIAAGTTNSFGAGGYDGYVTKVDVYGNSIWSSTYGGSGNEVFYDMKENTKTGQYIFTGTTTSFYGGTQQGYVLITDASGNCITSVTLGSGLTSEANGIQIASYDTGFWVAGSVEYYATNKQCINLWHINASGTIIYNKAIHNAYTSIGEDVAIDKIGNIYLGGYTNASGTYDAIVYKLSSDAITTTDIKTFGTSYGDEYMYTLYYDTNGDDLLLAGWQITNDGLGTIKSYNVHIETDLTTIWVRNNGVVSNQRYARWGQPYYSDYIMAGSNTYLSAGGLDARLTQFDDSGITQSEALFGGSQDDEFWSVSGPDSVIAAVGYTKSYKPNPTPGGAPLASDGKSHVYLVIEPNNFLPTITPIPTDTPIAPPANEATQFAIQTQIAGTKTAICILTSVFKNTPTVTRTFTQMNTSTATRTITPTATPTSLVRAAISFTPKASYAVLGQMFTWIGSWSIGGTTSDLTLMLQNNDTDFDNVTAVPTWTSYGIGSQEYTWRMYGKTNDSGSLTITAKVVKSYDVGNGPQAVWLFKNNQGNSVIISRIPVYTATVTRTITATATITKTATQVLTSTPQAYLNNINCGELTAVVTSVVSKLIWNKDILLTPTPGYGRIMDMTPVVITTPIANTTDDKIYQSMAWQYDNYILWMAEGLTPGKYRVTLKFIDHISTAIGQHTMQFIVNGGLDTVGVDGFDVYALSGKRNDFAVDMTYIVDVDSSLMLYLAPATNNLPPNLLVFISGISIQKIN